MNFGALQTAAARKINDPDHNTFSITVVKDFIAAALTEVGGVIPVRFIEDITPTADTLTYDLQQGTGLFNAVVPEVEVRRVELWDGSTTPDTFITRLQPGSGEFVNSSDVGWECWNGTLRLTNAMEQVIDPAVHFIKVWGYRPYITLTNDSDDPGLSNEAEQALLWYVRVEALEMLNASRELYSQWQTQTGNTDISPAGLMNELTIARDEWRRRSRKLMVLREAS